jgi:hypothetical protein
LRIAAKERRERKESFCLPSGALIFPAFNPQLKLRAIFVQSCGLELPIPELAFPKQLGFVFFGTHGGRKN